VGSEKYEQFKLTMKEYIEAGYPDDTEEDYTNEDNWKDPMGYGNQFHWFMTLLSGTDDDDSFRDAHFQCACSNTIHRLYFWKYKTLSPILVGCDCVEKMVGVIMAEAYKKDIDKEIRDGKKHDKKIHDRKLKLLDSIEKNAKITFNRVMRQLITPKIETQQCISCGIDIPRDDYKPKCLTCWIGTQPCRSCGKQIKRNKFKPDCLACYKRKFTPKPKSTSICGEKQCNGKGCYMCEQMWIYENN
jgi:hypothetical protein